MQRFNKETQKLFYFSFSPLPGAGAAAGVHDEVRDEVRDEERVCGEPGAAAAAGALRAAAPPADTVKAPPAAAAGHTAGEELPAAGLPLAGKALPAAGLPLAGEALLAEALLAEELPEAQGLLLAARVRKREPLRLLLRLGAEQTPQISNTREVSSFPPLLLFKPDRGPD